MKKENNAEALISEFDKKAEKQGWKFVHYGFGDTVDRKNPDGTPLFDGQAIYMNEKGEFADAYYVQELIQKQETK